MVKGQHRLAAPIGCTCSNQDGRFAHDLEDPSVVGMLWSLLGCSFRKLWNPSDSSPTRNPWDLRYGTFEADWATGMKMQCRLGLAPAFAGTLPEFKSHLSHKISSSNLNPHPSNCDNPPLKAWKYDESG